MADANFAQTMGELQHVRSLAAKIGIEAIPLEVRRADDIHSGFDKAATAKADALYVVINELLNANRLLIVSLAQATKLPAVYGTHDWVRSGGLMSYGPNFPALWARTADITDKILRGSKPGDIPVEQPTRFELVVNAKIAKTIGVNISENFLTRADEVIE